MVRHPQWESVRCRDELDVRTESAVFTGVPQVDRGALRPDRGLADPVGGDQRAVEDHVRSVRGESVAEHVGQFRGLRGEDVDALVQVPVAGGDGDAGVVGQCGQWGALSEPAQYEDRVAEGSQGAASAAAAAFTTVDLRRGAGREGVGRRAWQNR